MKRHLKQNKINLKLHQFTCVISQENIWLICPFNLITSQNKDTEDGMEEKFKEWNKLILSSRFTKNVAHHSKDKISRIMCTFEYSMIRQQHSRSDLFIKILQASKVPKILRASKNKMHL